METENRQFYFGGHNIIQDDYADSKDFDQFFEGKEDKRREDLLANREVSPSGSRSGDDLNMSGGQMSQSDENAREPVLLERILYNDLKSEFMKRRGYVSTLPEQLMDFLDEYEEIKNVTY